MSKRKARHQQAADTPSWHGFWPGLSDVNRHVVCLGFLLLVAIGFFAPIHFSDKQLIAGDTVSWLATAQSMVEYEEETGEAALWAGRAFSGMPGYMISPELSVGQVDSVFRYLRKLFWPSSFFFLLLSGTYLLAWFLSGDRIASVLAAVSYGLTTYLPVILVAGHNSKFIALAWAPWLLLSFGFVLRKRTLLSGLLFAVALACNLRAGHVQITYYVVMAAGIWWLVAGIRAMRTDELKPFLVATGWLFVGSALGLLMIAQPYLAQMEFAAASTRGGATAGTTGEQAWTYAMAWSQGPKELLTLLIADAFGGGGGTYWGAKTFTAGPHYFGGIAMACALLALWKARSTEVIALGIGAGLMVLFALGENAAWLNRPMFDFFPMFARFRVPETWLSVVALLAAVLAAQGLAWIGRSVRERSQGFLSRPGLMVMAGLLVFTGGLMLFSDVVLDFESEYDRARIFQQVQQQVPGADPSDPQVASFIDRQMAGLKDMRKDLFSDDARRTFLVLAILLFICFLYYRRTIPYWALAFSAVILVTVDLGGVGRRYINEERLTSSKNVDDEVARYPFDDFLLERKAEAGGDGTFRVLSLEGDPLRTARPSYYYESLGGYSGARLRVYEDFLGHILRGPDGATINDNALDMMNVRYLVSSRGLPGYDLVFQDDRIALSVFRNPDPLDRATFVDHAETLASAEDVWRRLGDDLFDPGSEILFMDGEVPADLVVDADSSGSSPSVEMDRYTGQGMTFSVSTDQDRWLLVSEVYYPEGWTATIDGQETPIYRADYLLRAVRIPAGSHTLTMVFAPASVRIGFWLTLVGTLVTYGLIVLVLAAGFRRQGDATP